MHNEYPVLKTVKLELQYQGNSDFSYLFPRNNLVVGIICPEISGLVENDINRINLKPYELACQRFSGSDYKYSVGDINSAGIRQFKGLELLHNATHTNSGFCVLIISYLEFENI